MKIVEGKTDIIAQAKAELQKEMVEEAKGKIKDKLHELNRAKKIVCNLQRELDDIYEEIKQDAEDVD